MQGIGRDVAGLRGGHGAPVGEVHLAPVAAAADHDRSGILLRTDDPIGILAGGGHMVDLRDGLGVPETPGTAVIERDADTLVGADHHALAVGGIDPEIVVILAAGGALEGMEGDAAVDGAVQGGADGIDDVGIPWVHEDAATVSALAVADALVLYRHVAPGGAAVVGAEKTGPMLDVVADNVDAPAMQGDRHANTAGERRNLERRPGQAAVGRFEQQRRLGLCLRAMPERKKRATRALGVSQHDAGITVVEHHFARAVITGGLEDVGPGPAAIRGAVDAAAVVGGVTEGGDDDHIGVGGINQDAVDHHGVFKADVLPGLAGIGGLPHAVAQAAQEGTDHGGVTGAGIHDIRIGGNDLNGADGIHAFYLVEDGEPGDAGTGGFPDASLGRARVIHAGLADDAGDRGNAAAVERADVPPLKAGIEVGVDMRGRGQGERQTTGDNQSPICNA